MTITRLDADGERELAIPGYEYQPLDLSTQHQRFLVLHPCPDDDKGAAENHVRCTVEVTDVAHAPFIAVRNSRGYRRLLEPIELDGRALFVPVAVEAFLRHYRRSDAPIRLWIRHICLQERHPDEQKQYWTRSFIDSMYDRAEDVVDMMEFNNGLIDRQIVAHCSLGSRNKDWSSVPEHPRVIPQVFPIRVGQRPSETSPTDTFAYVPLDVITREIRLVVIHPSTDTSAPVVAHLAHSPVDSEVSYIALSYTWGLPGQTATIIVNGQLLAIRANLESILRSLRASEAAVVVWIDAICIDQGNVAERNRHLPHMAYIYETASFIVSYLGSSEGQAGDAFDVVKKLQSPMMRHGDDGNWIVGMSEDDAVSPAEYPRLLAALYRLLTRSYFRRVWILQEVAHASYPMVLCHGMKTGVPFEDVVKAANNLQDMIRHDSELVSQIKAAAPDLDIVSESELIYIRKLSYFRSMVSRGGSSALWFSRPEVGSNCPGMLETAILARDFDATDGHDKIFALWDLAQDTKGLDFKMDYTQTIPRSFTDFVMAWTAQHKSLDMIAVSELNSQSTSFYEEAPSWCPDWTVPSSVSCLVRREWIPVRHMSYLSDLDGALYSADGGMKNDDLGVPLFEFGDDSLLCTGVILDEIRGFIVPDNPAEDGEEQETYYRTAFSLMRYVTEAYERDKYNVYDDPRRAAWSMFHGDVPSAWLPRDESTHATDRYPHEEYVCEQAMSRFLLQYAGGYDRPEAWASMKAILRGRVFAVSGNGYMCLVPRELLEKKKAGQQAPCYVAIIATCSVPVLLEIVDDGVYRLVGSCFVQGWMEGEVFQSQMGVNARQYWEANHESSKLIIL